MSRGSVDWTYLRKDMLTPVISFVGATIVFACSAWFYSIEKAKYEAHSSDQQAMHSDYNSLVYRRRLVERYHQRYKQLQQIGFVGQERRLDWITSIRTAALALDLPNASYSIEPQIEVIKPVGSTFVDADVQVRLSRLDLELSLLHELDMIRFFDRLQVEAPGLTKVDQCELVRQSDGLSELTVEANILARCSLLLFSVITSDAQEGGALQVKQFSCMLCSAIMLACSCAASASDPDGVELGRVFMSAEDRARLDRLRRIPKQLHSNVGNETIERKDDDAEQSSNPSGFISSSHGTPYKWIDGDFRKVSAAEIEDSNLPNGVQIISHRQSSLDLKQDIQSDDERTVDHSIESSDSLEDSHGTPR